MPGKEDLYQQGMEQMAEGKSPEAIALLQQAVEADPNHAEALHALAMLLYQTERYDEAIEAGKRLIGLQPEDIMAHTSLSMFYVAKGMVPEAEAEQAEMRRLTWKGQLREGAPPQGGAGS